MKKFLDENFLLNTNTSRRLYSTYAKELPIIDYHCHLSPQQIAEDTRFENLTQAWLAGDHYKWRAMRANGIDESYCTGARSDREKFGKWAETVPYTVRNPLYHWTHLELQRYFDIHELLSPATADRIYDQCTEKLNSTAYSVKNLLRKMNVRLVCTTDDPLDSLEHHQRLRDDGFEIPILPTFRPDASMNIADAGRFNAYLEKMQTVVARSIGNFNDYIDALKLRHDFFSRMGCKLSDHGLEQMPVADFDLREVESSFRRIRNGEQVNSDEQDAFRSAVLTQVMQWNHEKGWVQQFHLGPIRNNNTRKMRALGPDTGWDSIGDLPQASRLSRFLDKLDVKDQLAKTILYNINPSDNDIFASMIGNFNDGSSPGKLQWGAAWWFHDQQEGILRQLNSLSNMGLISRFIGMLTDSRSFLSFPRHEYFRRILCDLFGSEMERGELPPDEELIGKLIGDICFHNNNAYFNWGLSI